MAAKFFIVNKHPLLWRNNSNKQFAAVTTAPWEHMLIQIGSVNVRGRKLWGASEPKWSNEVIYYNTALFPLVATLTNIVVHHTNNANSISINEMAHIRKGNAALGYHFFIATDGRIHEGRPLEIMGSHAGVGKKTGALTDPDWGAIGIVLQGDYHDADNWFFQSNASIPKVQLEQLKRLIIGLKSKYNINKLLMHREVSRKGNKTVCPGEYLVPKIKAIRAALKMTGP